MITYIPGKCLSPTRKIFLWWHWYVIGFGYHIWAVLFFFFYRQWDYQLSSTRATTWSSNEAITRFREELLRKQRRLLTVWNWTSPYGWTEGCVHLRSRSWSGRTLGNLRYRSGRTGTWQCVFCTRSGTGSKARRKLRKRLESLSGSYLGWWTRFRREGRLWNSNIATLIQLWFPIDFRIDRISIGYALRTQLQEYAHVLRKIRIPKWVRIFRGSKNPSILRTGNKRADGYFFWMEDTFWYAFQSLEMTSMRESGSSSFTS